MKWSERVGKRERNTSVTFDFTLRIKLQSSPLHMHAPPLNPSSFPAFFPLSLLCPQSPLLLIPLTSSVSNFQLGSHNYLSLCYPMPRSTAYFKPLHCFSSIPRTAIQYLECRYPERTLALLTIKLKHTPQNSSFLRFKDEARILCLFHLSDFQKLIYFMLPTHKFQTEEPMPTHRGWIPSRVYGLGFGAFFKCVGLGKRMLKMFFPP